MRLAKAGVERYGTVVRQGVNDKSVVVKVYRYNYIKKYKRYKTSTNKIHAHD